MVNEPSLFEELLEQLDSEKKKRIIQTFINNKSVASMKESFEDIIREDRDEA